MQHVRKLVKAGSFAIAQDPDSCIISGMPKSLIEAGIADEIHSLNNLGQRMAEICYK